LVVGIAFDGTPRPMATAIVLASAGAFLAFRMLVPGQARAPS
jgi:hypothetical protein